MNISFDQQLNTSQQLNLAPQLLQWLRLLQVSSLDLSQVVQQELESNPALEVDHKDARSESEEVSKEKSDGDELLEGGTETSFDEDGLGDKFEFLAQIDRDWQDDFAGRAAQSRGRSDDSDVQAKRQFLLDSAASSVSLPSYLLDQLRLMDLSSDDLDIAEFIVGSLDNAGYLSDSVEDIAMITDRSATDVKRVLLMVQSMDPPGVAASDLRECLLIQLSEYPADSLPCILVRDYMEALARRQYRELAVLLAVEEDEVMDAVGVIARLSPNPSAGFEAEHTQYVNADVVLHRKDEGYTIELVDDHIPHLRISASCRRLIEKSQLSSKEATYVRGKIRGATFLIQGIAQRQQTLRKVTEQIVRAQRVFLDAEGELKPLTMAKVAGMIGVHETTVSRALANKYIQTPHGLFEMKHFFRFGYKCADGSAITPEAVKRLMVRLIDDETPGMPLKDLDIVARLKKRGLRLARRTVAKYRDELGVPSSKERKKLFVGSRRAMSRAVRPITGKRDVRPSTTAATIHAA